MSKLLYALNQIAADLSTIAEGNTVPLSVGSHTYATSVGANVAIGESVVDSELADMPRCTVYVSQALISSGHDQPEPCERAFIAVEAGALLEDGDDRMVVATQLLDDIRAAVKRRSPSDHHDPISYRSTGPVLEILNTPTGSNVVLVRRWYEAEYVEHYPPDEPI